MITLTFDPNHKRGKAPDRRVRVATVRDPIQAAAIDCLPDTFAMLKTLAHMRPAAFGVIHRTIERLVKRADNEWEDSE